MKTLLNWRQWVLYSLFAVVFFAVILIFGEDERPMAQWIEARIYLAAVIAVCSYLFYTLTRKWNREGNIKIMNYGNEDM